LGNDPTENHRKKEKMGEKSQISKIKCTYQHIKTQKIFTKNTARII
jgi:hypothetical protein